MAPPITTDQHHVLIQSGPRSPVSESSGCRRSHTLASMRPADPPSRTALGLVIVLWSMVLAWLLVVGQDAWRAVDAPPAPPGNVGAGLAAAFAAIGRMVFWWGTLLLGGPLVLLTALVLPRHGGWSLAIVTLLWSLGSLLIAGGIVPDPRWDELLLVGLSVLYVLELIRRLFTAVVALGASSSRRAEARA